MKSFLPILVVALLVITIALPVARPPVSASPKATVETLKQLEGEFMKTALEKGSQGYMSYYADDADRSSEWRAADSWAKRKSPKGWDFSTTKIINCCGRRSAATSRRRRSRLHVRQLRVPLQRQGRQGARRVRQVHQHLEIAEGRKVEGGARHGERPTRAEGLSVVRRKW